MGVSVGAFISVKTQGQNIKKDVRGTVSNIRSQKFGNMWKFLGGSREAIGLSGIRTYYNDSGVRVFFITLGKGIGYRIPDLNNGLRGAHGSTIKFALCYVGKGFGEYQVLFYSKFAREDRNLMLCETKVRRKPLCTREAAV